MLKPVLLLSTFAFAFAVGAQDFLKGKVVDSTSLQPLEAVSVVVINEAGNQTVTDDLGRFYLKINSKKQCLLFSYVGYKTLIAVPDTGEFVVKLQPDGLNLKDVTLHVSSTTFRGISKIDLDLKPVRNTQELLRLVPGLFIAQHAGGGKAEQIFLRGFDCDHGTDIDISVDGMPVNLVSHAHGQGYADTHFIIPETVNNIDFGTGPYYIQHGNLNTAGYVSFSTFNNIPKSRVQLEAGRFDTYRALSMIDLLKKNKEKQTAYVGGDLYYTNGPTDRRQNFNRFNLFGKYNVAISERTQFTASLSSFKSKWDASGQISTRAVESGLIDRFGSIDPTEGGNTKRHSINLLLAHNFSNNATWENRVYYSRYKFNLYSNFTFFLVDTISGDEINQAESRNLYGYVSKLTRKYFLSKGTLTSIYGGGFRYDATTNTKLAHVVKRQFLSYANLGDIHELNSYAYTEQQWSAGKWLIDGGMRFDYLHFSYSDKFHSTQLPSQDKSILSPKFNFQYTVNNTLQLYVKTGKGFHSNDARVVVEQRGHQILPAAYGADLGATIKPLPRFFINAAVWYLYLSQEFVYEGDDGNVEPSGRTRRTGIDLLLRYQFSPEFFANIDFSLTKPRAMDESKGQNYIPLAPTATSTGGLFYKPKQGFNGGLTYRYIKKRPANEDNSIVAKGYFLLDGSFNYTKPKYEVGIALENILNAEWNEAQFATTSRLKGEAAPVTELNFTPGTPFFARIKCAVFF